MAKFYVLGIDQSTQGTKAVLFDHSGKMMLERIRHTRQIIVKDQISHDSEKNLQKCSICDKSSS